MNGRWVIVVDNVNDAETFFLSRQSRRSETRRERIDTAGHVPTTKPQRSGAEHLAEQRCGGQAGGGLQQDQGGAGDGRERRPAAAPQQAVRPA
ncbi:hypothetical protein BU23DRAFT_555884, partial [Bimuria novae-zelandiae CBS 107.79]